MAIPLVIINRLCYKDLEPNSYTLNVKTKLVWYIVLQNTI